MKALGFAIHANAKNIHEITAYFIVSLSNHFLFFSSSTRLMNINHDKIAKIVKAITQRSVLLSTKTKNAHIQLHSHNNRIVHQIQNTIDFTFSLNDNLSENQSETSFIKANQKIKHKGHDKKFIETAIVSGESQFQEKIDQIPNQKVINIYHKYGIDSAVHIFHRNNQ